MASSLDKEVKAIESEACKDKDDRIYEGED
jgi:hypothetical protein